MKLTCILVIYHVNGHLIWLMAVNKANISSYNKMFLGDAGSFLLQLSKGLKGHKCPEEWPQSLKAGDETKENANR